MQKEKKKKQQIGCRWCWTRVSQRTHAKKVESKNIPGFRYLQQSKKPGDTEVTWSLGWRSWRPGSLPFMFSVALAHTQLLVWYDDNTIIVSASIGVPIPQFRGRSCPYRLPLYCDFVLLYHRERERERERRGCGEGLGSCLHLKTFVMKPQESQAALLSHWNWLPSPWLAPASPSNLSFFIAWPSFVPKVETYM